MRPGWYPPNAPEIKVAAFGLPGGRSDGGDILGDRPWSKLLAKVKHERLEGLLVAAVGEGTFPCTEAQTTDVRELGKARARVDLELERETLRVARMLETAGVEYRLLKGPALAHTVYPNPMWRGFGDVDILVAPAGWYAAGSILQASGARRLVPEVRPGFDDRFGKDATFVSTTGWQVDLHRRLVVGPYGFWAGSAEFFNEDGARIELGGYELVVLDPEDAFLYACYTAALADDPPRLMALRDVAQFASVGVIDVERIVDTALRWRGSDVVARALCLSERALGVSLSETTVGLRFRSLMPRRRHRALMATYRGRARGYTSQLAGVLALPGATNKLAYLRALARPQDSYLRARGFTGPGFILHAGRRIWRNG